MRKQLLVLFYAFRSSSVRTHSISGTIARAAARRRHGEWAELRITAVVVAATTPILIAFATGQGDS